MKYLLAVLVFLLVGCLEPEEVKKIIDPIDTVPAPVVLGYSLGLGCQGLCLDTNGDGMAEVSATEIYIGDITTARIWADSVTMSFYPANNRTLYIPDSLRVKYWDNASFMAAIALRAQGSGFPRQRTSITLPDHRLEIVRDSCVTWSQTNFPEPVPCIPILAIRP